MLDLQKSRYKGATREACKEHTPGGGGTSQTFLLLLLPFALVISTKYVLSTHLRVRWVGTPLAAQQSGQRRISTNSGPHRPFLLVPDARGREGVPRPAQHAARAQQACMARSPLFRQSPVFNLMMHAQGGANDPQQLSGLGLEFAFVSLAPTKSCTNRFEESEMRRRHCGSLASRSKTEMISLL